MEATTRLDGETDTWREPGEAPASACPAPTLEPDPEWSVF